MQFYHEGHKGHQVESMLTFVPFVSFVVSTVFIRVLAQKPASGRAGRLARHRGAL